MVYIACDGVLSTGAGGEVLCSGSWVSVASPVFTFAELGTADIAALVSSGLVVVILAYGFRVLRRQMGF